MKPSIGRIVHFRPDDAVTHYPAIVISVAANENCMLVVFGMPNSGGAAMWPWLVPHAANDADHPGTWHWPEREPQSGMRILSADPAEPFRTLGDI